MTRGTASPGEPLGRLRVGRDGAVLTVASVHGHEGDVGGERAQPRDEIVADVEVASGVPSPKLQR